MDDDEHTDYYPQSPDHEYPDPDYAAYVTHYPWAGEGSAYVLPESPDWQAELGSRGSQRSLKSDHPLASDVQLGLYPEGESSHVTIVESLDPDYQVSDAPIHGDEIISDEDSADLSDELGVSGDVTEHQFPQSNLNLRASSLRQPRKGDVRRRGRTARLGRGGKGIKRGPRKAIEPTEEFKALHSQATIAFIDQKYEEAEQLTLQAILINPEMYPAHNLLSQIYAATGNEDKAISAAWTGAHTKHRDPEIWSRTANMILNRKSDDRESIIRGAIYCINRIINLDKYSVEARYQRATLYHELGHRGRAAVEYEELLKQLPHDTTVLRHLAEIYIELERPGRALVHYSSSIAHYQALEPDGATIVTWSDVNIVVELYGFQERYREGIRRLKSLSRWLLGRGKASYWESFDRDDREWDLEDDPRRTELPEFVRGQYDAHSYGDGLPLELRVKLGTFRIKAEGEYQDEAFNHFEWLNPEDSESGAKLYEYTDLFREVANTLRHCKHYREAIRYYKPLEQVHDCDTSYLFDLASCYRALHMWAEAQDCYTRILDGDTANFDARLRLADLRQSTDTLSLEDRLGVQRAPSESQKLNRGVRDRDTQRGPKGVSLQHLSIPRSQPSRLVQPKKRNSAANREAVGEDQVHSLFSSRERLVQSLEEGSENCRIEWMAISKSLLQVFRDNKVFYPVDKYHKFYGYSKEARTMSSRPKPELDAMLERSESTLETPSGDAVLIPTTYYDIPFETWLDVFLEYALALAMKGDIGPAYETISAAQQANVFRHSSRSLFLIHVCWFACALLENDDETLCNIARWFIRQHPFVTDGYRLFSSLNKLCDSESPWYNCGPSQKYILRQLKAVDFSLLGDTHHKSLGQGRTAFSTKDKDGLSIQAADLDVALLMLYGHILHAGKSYSYAVNYYLRALALDPRNPMIKLSLALGYLHYALKRQAENRHQILMQGLGILLEYYDDRSHSASLLEQQEAEYNVGHAYHLLGLTHLAVPFYERCLVLSDGVQMNPSSSQAQDFALEAAINLQNCWAVSGNDSKACEFTEEWMVL